MPLIHRKLLMHALLPFTKAYQTLRPGIRILMYHRVAELPGYDQLTVSPARFKEQMAFLSENHRVISLDHAVNELKNGIAQPAVAVTFDDGYCDNLTNALPVLRKHHIPATIFITTEFCSQSLRHPRYPEEKGRLHLNWQEAMEMTSDPGITIGSHTLSHPFLTRVEKEKSRREIMDSRKLIQDKLGREVRFFCYPSGEFGKRETEYVREAGYSAAVTIAPGSNHDFSEPFELTRTEITHKDGISELKAKLYGAFDPMHFILHRNRRRIFAKAARESQNMV